jgi:hypothetical protein
MEGDTQKIVYLVYIEGDVKTLKQRGGEREDEVLIKLIVGVVKLCYAL